MNEYTDKDFAKDMGKALLQSLLTQVLAWAALLGLGLAVSKWLERKEKKNKK